ncbi:MULTISPECIES: nucleotidyltransferase domain-containing protein [Sphingobacterium]|uniref:Nucleotidyltransferase domain-containing protein n=1 Tax=Sphingobacterium ginsenosidimutans TaxID=687845 RepID=A0ABP8AB24_9SPHI|nr:nucleotidyltransferase domain-containing protein [Sphingobacterium sp. E70]ULT25939.1 nucleotidyltransferase domain-containing protein [Sphingobacterium sp. E70]
METKIKNRLNEIAEIEGISILFGCESGSRGWGFPSTDSDYDVRFFYIRKPSDYSSVFPLETELRYPITGELDISGWDLIKVLALLYKSNVSPFEWIQSPIVYHETSGFKEGFLPLIEDYFSARRQAHHYLGIVRSKIGDFCGGTIRLKTLFYILRSLLAAEWCITHRSYAPMALADLSGLMPEGIRTEVAKLVQLKSEVDEGFNFSCPAIIKDYLEERFNHLEHEVHDLPMVKSYKEGLEDYFKTILK